MSDDIDEWVLEQKLALEKAKAAGRIEMTLTAPVKALETMFHCLQSYFRDETERCLLCGMRADRYIMQETTRMLEKSLQANLHDWRRDADWRRNGKPKR